VQGWDGIGDLYFTNGLLAAVPTSLPAGTEIIEAGGHVVAPAFIDIHVHLREPGHEDAETVASGTRAAARGGFGTVVAMPNTVPPMDAPERLAALTAEARRHARCTVLPSACLTAGRQGQTVAALEALARAGAVAFTDDGATVMDDAVLREAMRRAALLGLPVMDHAQDSAAERQGVMHAGRRARELGFPGIPAEAETRIIARDIRLAEETGCALHIQHLSAAESLPLLREARRRGVRVTSELTPHHLVLCEDDIPGDDAAFKMNPPLRSREDRDRLREALVDGTIDCFATDHAPHTAARKAEGFLKGPFGVVGLETAVGVTWTALGADGPLGVSEWVRRWTVDPARILGMPPPSLAPGQPANLVVLDLETPWQVETGRFLSRSWNTCFRGRPLTGRAVYTFHRGCMVWKHV